MQTDGTSEATGAEGPAPANTAELDTLPPTSGRRRGDAWRWIVGGVVVVVVAAGIAGGIAVANRGSTKTPLMVLRSAAADTTSARTAHVTETETITSGTDTLQPLDVTADVDYVNKQSALTMQVNGTRIEDARSVNGVSYLRLTNVALPAGAHWVSIRPSDFKSAQKSVQALGSLNNDPSQGLQFLSGIAGTPAVVDKETLDGVAVTRYATTLNLQGVLDTAARGETALGANSLATAIGAVRKYVDVTRVPSEEWIDHAGRVRRFTMKLVVSDAGDNGTVLIELRFSQFGQPVNVTAPAASDTVAFSKVPNLFNQLTPAGG
jgi:hypothetical protein